MAYNISAFAGAGAQFFDNNGDPLVGGLLYVYTAGTVTPATTWTSNSGAVANTNPIVLDAAGRTPNQIWLNSGVTYKFILKTSTGVTIGTYDNIPAIDDPTVFNNLITVTGTNTLIGTSVPPYTTYVAGMTISFVAVNTNTGAVTIDVDGLGAKNIFVGSASPLSGGEIVAGRIIQLEYDGTRFQLQALSLADNTVTTAKLVNGAVTLAKLDSLIYGTTGASRLLQLTASNAVDTSVLSSKIQPITASVAANALTVTLNPTVLDFRSNTLSSGTINTRTVGAAVSVTVPSGATLGTLSGVAARLVLLAIDNAGTVELAIVNFAGGIVLDETALISTTAISAGATSNSVVYSTAARSNVPFRVVGYITSTQTTAGTWATAPSAIQGMGGTTVLAVENSLTLATAQNTTAGTSVDFTGIPSWVKRITVMFNNVSTTGTSDILIQLGTSGGFQVTGYTCAGLRISAGVQFTTGFGLTAGGFGPTVSASGITTIALLSGNVWSESGTLIYNAAAAACSAGSVTLSGTLDRIRITTVGGTDTFDAGSVNIMYE